MTWLGRGAVLESFEQLEQGMRDWTSFGDPDAYDAAGMVALLCACADNLRSRSIPAEIEDLAESMPDHVCEFLRTLIESKQSRPGEGYKLR